VKKSLSAIQSSYSWDLRGGAGNRDRGLKRRESLSRRTRSSSQGQRRGGDENY